MLALLLAACGYPTYYPNPPALPDTAPPGEETAPCSSAWAYEPVELRAVSTAGVPLGLFEISEDCAETFVGALSAHEILTVGTLPGIVFAARDAEGALHAWTQIPYGEPTFAWEVR